MHFQTQLMIPCALAGVLFLSACETTTPTSPAVPGEKAPDQVDWAMQSAFGSQLTIIGSYGVRFSREIREKSNGNITLKFYEPGAIFGGLDIFDAVRDNKVDAGYSTGTYFHKRSLELTISIRWINYSETQ